MVDYKFMKNRIKTFIILLFFVQSCTSTKNIRYFKDVPDSLNSTYQTANSNYTQPTIKQGDILLISIQTIDPQANNFIGSSMTTPMIASQGQTSNGNNILPTNYNGIVGYLVDNDGYIDLPLVGRLKVKGLTTTETQFEIKKYASKYYKEPVVNVRFSNFTITILGEVAKPGTYPIINEKINIIDAIGLASDLTIFGKRGNVLLIRDENGKRMMTRFDLRSTKTFQSPYFYLKQGDIIYVEPNKAKIANNDQAQIRNITIGSTILTSLALILSRIN